MSTNELLFDVGDYVRNANAANRIGMVSRIDKNDPMLPYYVEWNSSDIDGPLWGWYPETDLMAHFPTPHHVPDVKLPGETKPADYKSPTTVQPGFGDPEGRPSLLNTVFERATAAMLNVDKSPSPAAPVAPAPAFDAELRKRTPVYSGVLAYFPDALKAVAQVSYQGNQQHNPGQPLHWARSKSSDHRDCLIRHTMDDAVSPYDTDGMLHAAKAAWRALAHLQLVIEGLNPALKVPEAK